MTELQLRPYQAEALAALRRGWMGERRPTSRTSDHAAVRRPAVVLPTGAGKTVIFSRLGQDAHAGGGRALFLVHRDELADQTAAKLRMSAPHAKIGIVKGSRNEVDADLIVGSVQTLQHLRRREQIGRRGLDFGIADECHHAIAPSWAETMAYFGAYRAGTEGTLWAGFTATMTEGTSRSKTKLGDVWSEIVYSRPLSYFIENGYLVRPRGIRVQLESLELDGVRRSRGDLQAGDLGDALMDADAPAAASRALLEHAKDRRTAAFWPTVATAEAFVEECNELGIPAGLIAGTTPREERQELYRRFRDGTISCLATAMVLTEGWDAPWCDAVLIARPTSSPGLYRQMIGRGLRPWALTGKEDCLVLDLTGASERHDLMTLDELEESEPEDEDGAPARKAAPLDDEDVLDTDPWDDFVLPEADGPLVATEVDLFTERKSLWLQTSDRGWWFIPTANRIFFLYPQASGHYALGYADTGSVRKIERLEKDLSLEYAMAWAERYAKEADHEFGMNLSGRKASWRRNRKARATPAQIGAAEFHGIPREVAENLTKVELSDLISVTIATRVLQKVA